MSPQRSLRAATVTSVVLVLLLGAGAAADGATLSRKKAIWGPATTNGISNFPLYADLGVGIYQTSINWRDVALTRPADPTDPTDPAYVWPPDVDQAVRAAAHLGMQVSLMLIRTPAWANRGKDGNVPPNRPKDYADFAEAAARRWPTVRLWMVWGEPIRSVNFRVHPTGSPNFYVKPGTSPPAPAEFTLAQVADDRRYAELVDAAYGRLKQRNARNLIIGGNTTTSGDVDPFNWVRYMKLPDGRPPRMDLFGHNPFTSRKPDLKKDQILKGTADFSDLDVYFPWIRRHLSRKGRNRGLKLFISEFTAPTDVESYEFPFHVTRKVQAEWLAAGLRIVRRSPWIYSFGWIGLRDPAPAADGAESRTGLIDGKGRRKPAYRAFRRG